VRLALFGGTFDPPHVGHVLVASDVCDALAIDRLVWVPASQQPLKVGLVSASGAARLAMVREAITGDSRFECDAVEIDRGGLSYSADTLSEYAERFPEAERFFLVGQDTAETLPRWRSPERVMALCRLVIMRRTADPARSGGEEDASLARALAGVRSVSGSAEPLVVPTRRVDVSSTEIRSRVHAGKSIHGFVTEAVERYIVSHGLYR